MKNELKSMFTEHWKYLAVNAACELKLFDKIFENQNTFEKLIQINKWEANNLIHLLHFLISNEYLIIGEDDKYILSEKGNLLRESNPDGLYYACINWSGEHLNAWQNLKYSIETGKSSFENIYKKPYFDYINEHPEKLNNYHKAMFEYARDDYHNLTDIIDFSIHKSIMDIGGGYGAAIGFIQQKHPSINCILFDLEKVVQKVINDNLTKIQGDFFNTIPPVSDAIILSRVLHDWDNDKALVILKNCFNALPENGTLYIIENCTDKIKNDLSLLSLNMAVMCKSFERSSKEYIHLCNVSGFEFQSSSQLNNLQSILILKK